MKDKALTLDDALDQIDDVIFFHIGALEDEVKDLLSKLADQFAKQGDSSLATKCREASEGFDISINDTNDICQKVADRLY